MHWWGQRSCRGQLGLIRGQIAYRNAQGHQNLEEFCLDQSIAHCWGQRSCRVSHNYVWHIRKMLLMLYLHYLPNLTLVINTILHNFATFLCLSAPVHALSYFDRSYPNFKYTSSEMKPHLPRLNGFIHCHLKVQNKTSSVSFPYTQIVTYGKKRDGGISWEIKIQTNDVRKYNNQRKKQNSKKENTENDHEI